MILREQLKKSIKEGGYMIPCQVKLESMIENDGLHEYILSLENIYQMMYHTLDGVSIAERDQFVEGFEQDHKNILDLLTFLNFIEDTIKEGII